MIKENATQKGGQSVSATLDSVKAVLRRLSYLILANDFEGVGRIIPTLFDNASAYDSANGLLLSGAGLGHRVIRNYDNSQSEQDIKAAIATLKADGSFKEILEETQGRIDEEAVEAERIKREAKAEAERIEAELIVLREKQEEQLRIAESVREEADKAVAERTAKLAQEEADRRERLSIAAAKRAKRVAEQAEKAAQAKEDVEQAVEAAPEAVIGQGFAKYFENTYQQKVFVTALQSESALRFIPKDQHVAIAERISQTVDESNGKVRMSAELIKLTVNSITAEALGIESKSADKAEAMKAKNHARTLMENGVKEFRNTVAREEKAIKTISSALSRFPEMATSATIDGAILVVENHIALLQGFVNELKQHSTKVL